MRIRRSGRCRVAAPPSAIGARPAREVSTYLTERSKTSSTMKRTRKALIALSAATLLLLVAAPASAQASESARMIQELNDKLLVVALPITLLVEGILIYAVLKFRNNDDPKPTKENRRLEITWTVATAVILLFVGVASYGVMANDTVEFTSDEDIAPDENDVLVEAEAYQWGWNMHYPEQNFTVSGSGEGPTV